MMIGAVLRDERERVGLTQRQLARRIFISQGAVSNYEAELRPVPEDVLCRAIRALNSPRLMYQRCFECAVNPWLMPWLDKVDSHPVAVLAVALRELEEAKDALADLDLINKTAQTLGDEDRAKLDHAALQVAELIPVIWMFFGVLCTEFGYNLDHFGDVLYGKLVRSGYLTYQSVRELKQPA